MSGGGYPDDDEKEAQRAWKAEQQRCWQTHKQPCGCNHCYTTRADREWREYQDRN